MDAKEQVNELTTGLHEVEKFLEVFEDFVRNSTWKEQLDYANCILSMISMQSAKIDKIIEIAEKLESKLK